MLDIKELSASNSKYCFSLDVFKQLSKLYFTGTGRKPTVLFWRHALYYLFNVRNEIYQCKFNILKHTKNAIHVEVWIDYYVNNLLNENESLYLNYMFVGEWFLI